MRRQLALEDDRVQKKKLAISKGGSGTLNSGPAIAVVFSLLNAQLCGIVERNEGGEVRTCGCCCRLPGRQGQWFEDLQSVCYQHRGPVHIS